MKKIAIIYGSSTDNTKGAAEKIAAQLSDQSPILSDVADCSASDFEAADFLILGTSTWGAGDIQDDWVDMLDNLSGTDLSGKQVALFGLGDSSSYSDSFVDGMGELYEFLSDKGVNFVGQVSTDGYTFDDSRAVVDGNFVGLALDEDNEDDMTDDRIASWIEKIKAAL